MLRFLTAKMRKKPQSACKQSVLRLLKFFGYTLHQGFFVTEQIFLMALTGMVFFGGAEAAGIVQGVCQCGSDIDGLAAFAFILTS